MPRVALPMPFSAARCQLALAEQPGAAILEWDFLPLMLAVKVACRLVIGGAPRDIRRDGQPCRRYQVLELVPGEQLELGPAQGGLVGYLALEGGVEQAADGSFIPQKPQPMASTCPQPAPWSRAGAWAPTKGTLRCLPGPEWSHDFENLLAGPWRMTRQRDRCGIRLQGPALPQAMGFDISPAPVVDGTVQLTRSGPIILMRDRGTIGGYPRGWVVIAADIDIAAQMPSGIPFQFVLLSQGEALEIEVHKAACLSEVGNAAIS